MAIDEVTIATAALVIAVVALLTAFGQVIQQLFSTADGYRRCQSSVIGDWSQLARLRFRWYKRRIGRRSSCRLEVRVTTPHFEICQLDKAYRPSVRPAVKSRGISSFSKEDTHGHGVAITGSDDSRQRTLSRIKLSRIQDEDEDEDDNEDVVSWSSLLVALHDRQQLALIRCRQDFWNGKFSPQVDIDNLKTLDRKHALVCVKPKTRSWDLMPPDVVRPMASTTLGTLITIAHRMGMQWLDLIPRDGKLRAEGLNQSFSATLVRGLGIVVDYTVEQDRQPFARIDLFRSLYVPSFDADKMAYGIIPGNSRLLTWDMHIRSQDGDPDELLLSTRLNGLSIHGEAIETIKRTAHDGNTEHRFSAFADVLALWTDWIPLSGSMFNSIVSPFSHRIYIMSEVYEARVVWWWILKEQERQGTISHQRTRMLQFYDEWIEKEPHRFYSYYKPVISDVDYEGCIAFFKRTYDKTTTYFEKLCRKTYSDAYVQLISAHVNSNAHTLEEAVENMKAGTSRNDGRVGHNLLDTLYTERAFLYVDNIPRVIEMMKLRGFPDELAEDAWWMLMLRGQCWEMGINRVFQKSCVPSSYYNSPARVYIQ